MHYLISIGVPLTSPAAQPSFYSFQVDRT